MKNTFKYTVHRWIDIWHESIPSSLLSKLAGLETYKDQVIHEHFYNVDNFAEHCQENGIFLTNEEQEWIDRISSWQTKEDAAYFRIVYS